MPLTDHLGELRKRIIFCLTVFVIGLIGGLFGSQPVFDYLVEAAPVKNLNLHAFSPWDAIGLYMKFAFLISFVAAIPFAMFQLWLFAKPALGEKEQKATLVYVPWALVMFLVGLAFSYFVVFPMAFLFTEKVTINLGLEETYGVSQYFSFLINILLPISLLFELPLVILFLSRIGILSPALLVRIRKIAWLILIAIGVMVTPPDVVSDLLVALPLVLLYEVSVILSKLAFGRRQRTLERQEALQEA